MLPSIINIALRSLKQVRAGFCEQHEKQQCKKKNVIRGYIIEEGEDPDKLFAPGLLTKRGTTLVQGRTQEGGGLRGISPPPKQ